MVSVRALLVPEGFVDVTEPGPRFDVERGVGRLKVTCVDVAVSAAPEMLRPPIETEEVEARSVPVIVIPVGVCAAIGAGSGLIEASVGGGPEERSSGQAFERLAPPVPGGTRTRTSPSAGRGNDEGIVTAIEVPPPVEARPVTVFGVPVAAEFVNQTVFPVAAKLVPAIVRTPPTTKEPESPVIRGFVAEAAP